MKILIFKLVLVAIFAGKISFCNEFQLGFQSALKLLLGLPYCKFPHANYTTCRHLPKKIIPKIEDFIVEGKFIYHYTLNTDFDCTDTHFTFPDRGSAVTGGGYFKEGNSRFATVTLKYSSDRLFVTTTKSSSNKIQTWYCFDSEIDHRVGGFYAVYVCNGDELEEFLVGSNNESYHERELAAVLSVRNVPNGFKIHPAVSVMCDNPYKLIRFALSDQARALVKEFLPLKKDLLSLLNDII